MSFGGSHPERDAPSGKVLGFQSFEETQDYQENICMVQPSIFIVNSPLSSHDLTIKTVLMVIN